MSSNNVTPLHEGIEIQQGGATPPPVIHPGITPVTIDVTPLPGAKLYKSRRSAPSSRETVILEELRTQWPFGELPAKAIAEMVGVTEATACRWRRERVVPKPVQLLGHILNTGDLGVIHAAWAGWKLHNGWLSGPNSRRPFTPQELDAHSIAVQRVAALEATVRRQQADLELARAISERYSRDYQSANALGQLEALSSSICSVLRRLGQGEDGMPPVLPEVDSIMMAVLRPVCEAQMKLAVLKVEPAGK